MLFWGLGSLMDASG